MGSEWKTLPVSRALFTGFRNLLVEAGTANRLLARFNPALREACFFPADYGPIGCSPRAIRTILAKNLQNKPRIDRLVHLYRSVASRMVHVRRDHIRRFVGGAVVKQNDLFVADRHEPDEVQNEHNRNGRHDRRNAVQRQRSTNAAHEDGRNKMRQIADALNEFSQALIFRLFSSNASMIGAGNARNSKGPPRLSSRPGLFAAAACRACYYSASASHCS